MAKNLRQRMPQLFPNPQPALAHSTLGSAPTVKMLSLASLLHHAQFYSRSRLFLPGIGNEETLQCTRYFLYFEALDDIASLDVVVVLKGHATFVTLVDLANLVLEPLQSLERAFVDNDVVA